MRFVIALLVAGAPLAAQSADWDNLRQFNYSGEAISVRTYKKVSCNLDYVTDTALFCVVIPVRFLPLRPQLLDSGIQ